VRESFKAILEKIASIEDQVLDNTSMEVDLFTKKQDLEILKILHPRSLGGYIKPLSLSTEQPIKIFTQEAEPQTIYHTISPTTYGNLLIATTDLGVCYVSFLSDDSLKNLQTTFPESEHKNLKTNIHEIAINYLANKPVKTLPLHIKGTSFQQQVWECLLHIPRGQLSTYKHIAIALNKPRASIAVGAAVGKNPIALFIPCHRVIRSSGLWNGYRWGNKYKAALLAYELT